ncbi:MAG TPA: C39 family peptidase [Myxococcales bacterium]|nr:C39 family peptidase [Myxococcales bacterium]
MAGQDLGTDAAKPELPIAPDDAVRAPADMAEADRGAGDGRWLEVPRLPQFNGTAASWLWCGRAAAAMLYDYYCKAQSKTSEYVGHKTGDPGPGSSGKQKENLRFMGGSNDGKLAGITEGGRIEPAAIFDLVGWKLQQGYLQKSVKDRIDASKAGTEKRFAPVLDALRANNPVVLYTGLAAKANAGHTVVISGFKKQDGDLWLRVTDPTTPQITLIGARNLQVVQQKPQAFSEYWVKARALLELKLLNYQHDELLGRYMSILDQQVKDDAELVHKLSGGAPSAKKDDKAAAPEPPAPPKEGRASAPAEVNKSTELTAERLTSFYHMSERGLSGHFPLGDAGLFHSGAHFSFETGHHVSAMAKGELVAARIGAGPGEHPWSDTGFVLLRHILKGDKTIYSLFLHLQREPLHPDRTNAAWLRRLLIEAMGGDAEQKPKWRVTKDAPTWKDEDKKNFSPTNVQNDKTLAPGVYKEQDRWIADHAIYVRLQDQWIRASMQDGEGLAKELSPWLDFDIEAAAKKSGLVKSLHEGKTAVFDADKKDGKRKWQLEAGEVLGMTGRYLGVPSVHWSVFSKDAVFPEGSLPAEEFDAKAEVKLKSLDLSEDHGKIEHTQKLLEALDPDKKFIAKVPQNIVAPGEVGKFYRSPTESWRSRYLAVKGLCEFALDVDKFIDQERFKSHTDQEKQDFKKNAKAFLFWNDLSSAEDFPGDGKAVFVHPVTALRLMAGVAMGRDTDDAPEAKEDERLHPHDDVLIVLRDAKGPLAEAKVSIKLGKTVLHEGVTDASGQLLVPLAEVKGQELEVEVDAQVVGEKGEVLAVANETLAPPTLTPGDAPGKQTYNGVDMVPDPQLALSMKVKAGQSPGLFAEWNDDQFKPEKRIKAIPAGTALEIQRMVFRRDDGSYEAVQTHLDGQLGYLWSVWNKEENLEPDPASHQQAKEDEPVVLATWSARIAHLNDHPVFAGRVQNLDDGAELEITFCAIFAAGAPEHDEELHAEKVKVAGGGFSVAFDPHQLTADAHLLASPRPVFARVKAKDKLFVLRDQAITVHADTPVQDRPPAPAPAESPPGATDVICFTEIKRKSPVAEMGELVDRHNTFDGKEPQLRKLSQLSGDAARRFVNDGADELYVGATVNEMHLALEEHKNLGYQAAMKAQRDRFLQLFPEGEKALNVLFAKPEEAYFKDNGMTVGICAQNCGSSLDPRGKAAGCSEAVRLKNLMSCQYAPDKSCQTAVKPPEKGKTLPVVDHCKSSLGDCHHAGHDKTHCYLETVVRGPEHEERERWYVSLPIKTADNRQHPKKHIWPYHAHHETGRNLRVVLVNPLNGSAVVCSMEDYGPSGPCKDGNVEVPQAAVDADGMKGWYHICGMSYETFWKLGFSTRAHGDPVVLFAFVPATTPLGPLKEGALIKVRKQASYDQIMGLVPVPAKAEAAQ